MVLSDTFDALLEPVSRALGFPVDNVKFILFILLSYPLGALYRRIPSASGRYWWSIGVGLFMLLASHDFIGLVHFFAGPLLVYALLNVLPSKYAPTIAFIIMMGYLSVLHIHRMITDWMGYRMDVTCTFTACCVLYRFLIATVMVAVIKVTSFACNFRDGKLLDTPEQLTPAWQKYAIRDMPSLLEYISFLFYFPTFLAGPALHFSAYRDFIEGRLYIDPKFNPKGEEPSPVYATIEALLISVACLVIYVVGANMFPADEIFKENGLAEYNILYRLVYLVFSMLAIRCRYYFAWKMSEGAGILSGLGFNGYSKDGKPLFDRLCNIYILKVELAGSLRDLTVYWNYATGEWLKNYVYMRQAESAQARVPTWAMYLTNTVSAFWHGFYPGYYIGFIKASIEIDIYRKLRARFRPYFAPRVEGKEMPNYPLKHAYDFIGTSLLLVEMNRLALTGVLKKIYMVLISGMIELIFAGQSYMNQFRTDTLKTVRILTGMVHIVLLITVRHFKVPENNSI